ncbi:MAG: AMP-binding protein [Thermaerobacter sp.]|nr:AMP-binding protein [Thermaerobacter sp.]
MEEQLARNLAGRCSVGDIATRGAAHHPNRLALVDGDVRLTYQEFNRLACRLGQALMKPGQVREAPVAIMGRNTWQFVVSFFGAAKAGRVAMPINLGLDAENIAYCLRDAGAQMLIADAGLAPLVEAVRRHLPELADVVWYGDGVDPAVSFEAFLALGSEEEPEVYVDDREAVQLLYTSGTTSRPKGVLTSHLAVTITALSSALQNQLTYQDRTLHILPLFHCAALNALAMPGFVTGGTAYLLPAFDAGRVAELVESERLTIVFLLPMMWQALLEAPGIRTRQLDSLRLAMFAMAPMLDSRIAELQELFPNANVLLGSGQTEFTPPTTFQLPQHQRVKSGSWGSAVATTDVRIMDDNGRLLENGQVGEIVYRGPQAMTAYLHQEEATQAAFRHGWFHSGDVGWMDEEGVVWFTDRKKDMVKTGGENVASLEVERCLLAHPAVMDVSVIGIPHPYWGEAVMALVIPRAGVTVDEATLLTFAKERLAGFKVPKRVLFVQQFPRTGTGKIQKNLLRETYRHLFDSDGTA